MAVTYSITVIRYKILTASLPNGYVTAVSLLKPPCSGFRIETATWIQKWFKKSVGTSRKL
jgi:hypothetical protein